MAPAVTAILLTPQADALGYLRTLATLQARGWRLTPDLVRRASRRWLVRYTSLSPNMQKPPRSGNREGFTTRPEATWSEYGCKPDSAA